MQSKRDLPGTEEPTLSITALAERTGVPAATLRSWESRYGAPLPTRLPGGHRRYGEGDVAMVEEVLRLRAGGLSLRKAIEQARADGVQPETSVFAALRRRYPELTAHVLSKATMLALSRAIEDECCAQAERPMLFAGFQHPRFYLASRQRWLDLARTAEAAVVFADFPRRSRRGSSPVQVPLPGDAPMLREWVIVCDAPDHPACLAGWEHPGQEGVPDRDRRFEAVWSVDPQCVRHAARTCAQILAGSEPGEARALADHLAGSPPPASPDLRRAAGLLNRMLGYVERSRRGPEPGPS